MGTVALLLSCFAASVLLSAVIDFFAAGASIVVADYGGTESSGGELELLGMIGRPGLMFFISLGLWIGLFIYARKAVREEGRSRPATAAQAVLIAAPVLAVLLGVALMLAGQFWALGLEAQ